MRAEWPRAANAWTASCSKAAPLASAGCSFSTACTSRSSVVAAGAAGSAVDGAPRALAAKRPQDHSASTDNSASTTTARRTHCHIGLFIPISLSPYNHLRKQLLYW